MKKIKTLIVVLIIGFLQYNSCKEKDKGRFFTKEAFENELGQSVNTEVLGRIKKDTSILVEKIIFSFYFITDKRKKIDALMDYLEEYEPNQHIIELNQINQIWELNGRSYPIKLNSDSINKWENKMREIGYKFDCRLDSWESIDMDQNIKD